eukprot:TRINITY_DN65846_c8_g7_i1.p1 TRINITY_DN65846_c8_g7~~TRINITY_DN65846_c8_g7_i1.p1  ORF type:complete len:406 (-),score=208.39 TRINITY_DN65846_c8_g7_i1:153-1370(-)
MSGGGEVGNFKGVMLSVRPTAAQGRVGGTGGSSAAAAGGAGGAGGGGGGARSSSSGQPVFMSAVSAPTPLGYHIVKEKHVDRSVAKKNRLEANVTRKHKKWLAQLQEQRRQAIEELQQEEERKAKLAAQSRRAVEKKRRQMLGKAEQPQPRKDEQVDQQHQAPADEAAADNEVAATNQAQLQQQQQQRSEQQEQSERPQEETETETETGNKENVKGRPAWALTEEQTVELEEEEVDDLLDFANSLNFEAFIHDAAVREAMVAVKARIEELQAKGNQEIAQAELDEQRRELHRLQQQQQQQTSADTGNPFGAPQEASSPSTAASPPSDSNNNAIAVDNQQQHLEAQLSRDLRNVHSRLSVRSMIAKEQQRQQQAVPEPRITTIVDNDRATTPTNELPFLHRTAGAH